MFERFSTEARRVVVLAQEEADELGHDYVGTEHLLLGLVADETGAAGRVLAELGVIRDQLREDVREAVGIRGSHGGRLDPAALATIGIDFDEVRRRVEETFGPDALRRTRAGCRGRHRPFTPRSKGAMERSLRAALELGSRHIGSEHILLGVLSDDGLAVTVLERQGISQEAARAAVLERLSGAA
jgi:ATP-dependent Clp protease ATP-binding subunit ClpA